MVSATVEAIMGADLPPGVTRTLYLCDDGKVRGGGGNCLGRLPPGGRGGALQPLMPTRWSVAPGGPLCLLPSQHNLVPPLPHFLAAAQGRVQACVAGGELRRDRLSRVRQRPRARQGRGAREG